MDFEKTSLKNIEDKDYFNIGKVDFFNHKELVISASFLKMVFDRDLYEMLIKGGGTYSKELLYAFDVGSAFHCYVLEADKFESRYYVEDRINLDEKRVYINSEDFDFIDGCYKNIKIKYPHILENQDDNEVTILTNFDGVPYRAKIDKPIYKDGKIIIVDLKSVWFDFYAKKYKRKSDGIKWGLIKEMKDLNYDLGGYCYWKAFSNLVEEKNLNVDVEFALLLCSKETYDVKMVTFGSDMFNSGKDKFNIVFPEIKSFFDFGYTKVNREEII